VHYGLGVDLGTSFLAAAISRPGHQEMIVLGDRSVVAPAVVYRHEDGTIVTGDAAGRWGLTSPGRCGRDAVRRLGDPTPIMLGGVPHAVTDLLGAMLRDVVRTVSASQGGPPDHIVVTRPAGWGPHRCTLFDQVVTTAGPSGAVVVTAPEAAVAHYSASRRPDDGTTVAVYDLGGGTFDAAVLRTGPHRPEILGAPEGLERLGGVDFDDVILSYVNYRTGGALSDLDLQDPRTAVALARLRQDCVAAKEALSADSEATVPVYLPGGHLDVRLTRTELEDMLRAPVESTISALSRALRSARVSPGDLSAVLLVGGSSRIPLVGRMVPAALPGPPLVRLHPDHAVALGAAELARRMPDAARRGPPGRLPPPGPGPVRGGPATAGPRMRRPAPPPGPPLPRPGSGPPPMVPAPPSAAQVEPEAVTGAEPQPGAGGDWQAPSIGRLLVIGTGLLALAVVVGLVAYAVISRL